MQNQISSLTKLIPSTDHIKTIIYTSIATTVMTSVSLFVQNKIEEAKKLAMSEMDLPNMEHNMDDMMTDMSMNLEGLTGAELEKQFLQDMIVHHEGAIEMAETLKAGTKRPELVKMADNIISAQKKEVLQMETWLDTWFPVQK